MGSVGYEATLAVEGRIQPCQQSVEGVGKVLELIIRTLEIDPLVQGPFGQPLCCRGHLL